MESKRKVDNPDNFMLPVVNLSGSFNSIKIDEIISLFSNGISEQEFKNHIDKFDGSNNNYYEIVKYGKKLHNNLPDNKINEADKITGKIESSQSKHLRTISNKRKLKEVINRYINIGHKIAREDIEKQKNLIEDYESFARNNRGNLIVQRNKNGYLYKI